MEANRVLGLLLVSIIAVSALGVTAQAQATDLVDSEAGEYMGLMEILLLQYNVFISELLEVIEDLANQVDELSEQVEDMSGAVTTTTDPLIRTGVTNRGGKEVNFIGYCKPKAPVTIDLNPPDKVEEEGGQPSLRVPVDECSSANYYQKACTRTVETYLDVRCAMVCQYFTKVYEFPDNPEIPSEEYPGTINDCVPKITDTGTITAYNENRHCGEDDDDNPEMYCEVKGAKCICEDP
jgi:hypothetical protein